MGYKVDSGEVVRSDMKCQDCPYFRVSKIRKNPPCQFDQPKLGGFKGTRPHYIKYRIITDAVNNNSAKEDFMTCFNWVENMQRRSAFGAAQRANGIDGEIISVIGQEGDTIELRTRVAVNSLGEIVKPNAELAPKLEASKYVIAPDARSGVVDYKDVVYRTTVPNYEEEQNRVRGYSDSILKRQLAEQDAVAESEEEIWSRVKAKMETTTDALPVPPGVAVAEPVKRTPPGGPQK